MFDLSRVYVKGLTPGRKRLLKSDERILLCILRSQGQRLAISIRDLARLTHNNRDTVDKTTTRLQREGLVEAEENFDENHAQIENTWYLTPEGERRAWEVFDLCLDQ